MAEVPVYNMKGQAVGKMALDKNIFNGEVNEAILYQAIKMYESNLRQGRVPLQRRLVLRYPAAGRNRGDRKEQAAPERAR